MKLKNLFSISLLILSLAVTAQEKKTETILFIELNQNPKEIAVAKKVAKEKGMNLVVLPVVGKPGDPIELEKQVTDFLTSNKINSLVLSGHNGGDSYSGDQGKRSISVGKITSILEQSGSQNDLTSLYLLGCNSANKAKIFFWKSALPNLKFIAGYDGTAPLGHIQSGLSYFEDALRKQKEIVKTSDEAKLKELLSGLKFVGSHPTSVYACTPEDKEFLLMGKRKGTERYGKFDTAECSTKVKDFYSTYKNEIQDYWLATKEPTALSPSNGFLKDAYVFLRQNEHCFKEADGNEGMDIVSPDALLFLRFNKDFNWSFATYYRPLFEDFKKDLDLMINDPEAVAKKFAESASAHNAKVKAQKENPAALKRMMTEEMQKNKAKMDELLAKNPGLKQCMETTPSCPRFKYEKAELSELDEYSYSLQDLETMNRLNEERPSDVEGYIKQLKSHSDELKALKIGVEKMITQPDKLTRKEMLEVGHKLNAFYWIQSGNLAAVRKVMGYNEQVDGELTPFSWHEKSADGKVEKPLGKYRDVDYIRELVKNASDDKLGYLKEYKFLLY